MVEHMRDPRTDGAEIAGLQSTKDDPRVRLAMLEDQFAEVTIAGDQHPGFGVGQREHTRVDKSL